MKGFRFMTCLAPKKTRLKTVYYYHVTYVFQSESTLFSYLNVKELIARTQNHLVRKRTLNHLPKLAYSPETLSTQSDWILTLSCIMPHNDLTHLKSLAAFAGVVTELGRGMSKRNINLDVMQCTDHPINLF